jgi:hypothetical protein
LASPIRHFHSVSMIAEEYSYIELRNFKRTLRKQHSWSGLIAVKHKQNSLNLYPPPKNWLLLTQQLNTYQVRPYLYKFIMACKFHFLYWWFSSIKSSWNQSSSWKEIAILLYMHIAKQIKGNNYVLKALTGTKQWDAHLPLILIVPIKFHLITASNCREIARK